MATGSGKTVVMAMLIAWQTLNKLANPQDSRFCDQLPGRHARHHDPRPPPRPAPRTIPATFYRTMDLVTPEQLDRLQAATIVITNFHAFIRREKIEAAALTKKVLAGLDGDDDRFQETPAEMVRRVCARLRARQEHRRPQRRGPPLLRPRAAEDDGRRARRRRARRGQARTTRRPGSGCHGSPGRPRQARHPRRLRPLGHAVLPQGLRLRRGHALPVGRLGLRADGRDRVGHRQDPARPGRRRLDDRRRPDLPRPLAPRPRRPPAQGHQGHGRPTVRRSSPRSSRARSSRLYARLRARTTTSGPRRAWARRRSSSSSARTRRSRKLVFDWIAGWERQLPGRRRRSSCPATSPLFSQRAGRPLARSPEHAPRRLGRSSTAATPSTPRSRRPPPREIERVQARVRRPLPGPQRRRDLTDEDILREVMNTVGKPGRLGERDPLRRLGLDAHRGLGRQHRHPHPRHPGLRDPAPVRAGRRPGAPPGELRPERRTACSSPSTPRSTASRSASSRRRRAGQARPPKPVRHGPGAARAGAPADRVPARHRLPLRDADRAPRRRRFDATLDPRPLDPGGPDHDRARPDRRRDRRSTTSTLREQRLQTVVYTVAKRTLDNYFRDEEGAERPWLFPQLVRDHPALDRRVRDRRTSRTTPTRRCSCSPSTATRPPSAIYRAIVAGTPRREAAAARSCGRTRRSARPTTSASRRPRPATTTTKSHLNRVVLDSGWETKLAEVLEEMPEVVSYAKNQRPQLQDPVHVRGPRRPTTCPTS